VTNAGSVVSLGVFTIPVVSVSTVYATGGASFPSASDAQVATLNAAFLNLIQSRHPQMDGPTAQAILAAAQCDYDAISAYSTYYAEAKAGTLAL